jgi:hypothetical protein
MGIALARSSEKPGTQSLTKVYCGILYACKTGAGLDDAQSTGMAAARHLHRGATQRTDPGQPGFGRVAADQTDQAAVPAGNYREATLVSAQKSPLTQEELL